MNLLLITDGENRHCTAIKSLLRLLSEENRVKRDQQYYCVNCLQVFNWTVSQNKHYGNCIDHKAVQTEISWKEKDKWVQYHNGQKQLKVPFIMYAGFESILEPMEKNSKGRVNKHVPLGFAVYSKFAYGNVPDPLKAYRRKRLCRKTWAFIDWQRCCRKSMRKRLLATFA